MKITYKTYILHFPIFSPCVHSYIYCGDRTWFYSYVYPDSSTNVYLFTYTFLEEAFGCLSWGIISMNYVRNENSVRNLVGG